MTKNTDVHATLSPPSNSFAVAQFLLNTHTYVWSLMRVKQKLLQTIVWFKGYGETSVASELQCRLFHTWRKSVSS